MPGVSQLPAYHVLHDIQDPRRYIHYEQYLLCEVLPFMDLVNGHPCTIAHGASLGTFQAVNLAMRHPHLFRKVSAFSGRYDLTLDVEIFPNLFDGYSDENFYFHTPSHFLPNLACPWRIQKLRELDIILTIGQEDPFLDNNLDLSRTLHQKGVGHALHLRDGRTHQGSAWREMARQYL